MAARLSHRVLLTGATGLIGGWVRREWPSDGSVVIPVGSAQGDLLQPGGPERLVTRERPTHVVHLAWSASGTPGYRSSTDNAAWYQASVRLVEAARSAGAQCWLTGSVVDAADPAGNDLDPYTLHKAMLRRTFAADIDAGEVGWFRPAYVVDGSIGRPALVAEALAAARAGRAVALRTPSDRHDFVHAADVARAMVTAVTADLTGLLAVGSGRSRTVSELVEALGARWSAVAAERTEHHSVELADIEWLTARGWRPRYTDMLFGTRRGLVE
ncbi:NAD-dependent epimerase/dehydratase family protein [Oryzobacter telluris]|uniref:NAD-dependent epimerase/dehydratase family protein n=1 Tax=Oryzobacter telluris TaxID=3149179 RepID=UPI00370D4D19